MITKAEIQAIKKAYDAGELHLGFASYTWKGKL